MKLNKLLKLLRTTKQKAGKLDVDVEFWVDDTEYVIEEIKQFSIIPDIIFHLKIKE